MDTPGVVLINLAGQLVPSHHEIEQGAPNLHIGRLSGGPVALSRVCSTFVCIHVFFVINRNRSHLAPDQTHSQLRCQSAASRRRGLSRTSVPGACRGRRIGEMTGRFVPWTVLALILIAILLHFFGPAELERDELIALGGAIVALIGFRLWLRMSE
jgi:hypothetical protein